MSRTMLAELRHIQRQGFVSRVPTGTYLALQRRGFITGEVFDPLRPKLQQWKTTEAGRCALLAYR